MRDWPPGNFPARTRRSPSTMRRATASIRPKVRSAVASVVTGGTTVTGIPRGRRGDVDVGGGDRLRRDEAQIRIGRDHRTVDLVVQQAEQDIGLAHRRNERALRDDAARRKDLDARHRAQTLERLLGDRLGHEDARRAYSSPSGEPSHDAGDAVDRDLRAVGNAPRRVEHAEHHRDAALARQRSQMRGRAAKLGDDAGDPRQDVAERRTGDAGDQNIARARRGSIRIRN